MYSCFSLFLVRFVFLVVFMVPVTQACWLSFSVVVCHGLLFVCMSVRVFALCILFVVLFVASCVWRVSRMSWSFIRCCCRSSMSPGCCGGSVTEASSVICVRRWLRLSIVSFLLIIVSCIPISLCSVSLFSS